MRDLTGDGRGVVVTLTERGLNSCAVVRGDWAAVVAAAADGNTAGSDAALHVMAAVEDGLSRNHPRAARGGLPELEAPYRGSVTRSAPRCARWRRRPGDGASGGAA